MEDTGTNIDQKGGKVRARRRAAQRSTGQVHEILCVELGRPSLGESCEEMVTRAGSDRAFGRNALLQNMTGGRQYHYRVYPGDRCEHPRQLRMRKSCRRRLFPEDVCFQKTFVSKRRLFPKDVVSKHVGKEQLWVRFLVKPKAGWNFPWGELFGRRPLPRPQYASAAVEPLVY